MTADAVEVTDAGWYQYAGPIERWWDGDAWADYYRRAGVDEVLDADDLDATRLELAVAEPVPVGHVPDGQRDNAGTDPVVDASSPAPRTDRRRVRALRRSRPAHAATYCPHTAAYPLGDDMASQAAYLVQQLLASMGYDPNDVTSVHVARTDSGLEAAVTVLEPGVQARTLDAPQRTDIVHLGY